MFCPKCGSKVGSNYNFCPVCGERVSSPREGVRVSRRRDPFEGFGGSSLFKDDFFSDFFRSSFLNFPKLRRGIGDDSRSGGFSVKIVRSGENQPKVSVRTFGDMKGREKELFGGKVKSQREERPKIEEIEPREFDEMKEPECEICKKDGFTVINVELPDVKNMDDVDVSVYSESLEIRAYADNTAFFRIVKIPRGAKLRDQKLKDGKLILKLR